MHRRVHYGMLEGGRRSDQLIGSRSDRFTTESALLRNADDGLYQLPRRAITELTDPLSLLNRLSDTLRWSLEFCTESFTEERSNPTSTTTRPRRRSN